MCLNASIFDEKILFVLMKNTKYFSWQNVTVKNNWKEPGNDIGKAHSINLNPSHAKALWR